MSHIHSAHNYAHLQKHTIAENWIELLNYSLWHKLPTHKHTNLLVPTTTWQNSNLRDIKLAKIMETTRQLQKIKPQLTQTKIS